MHIEINRSRTSARKMLMLGSLLGCAALFGLGCPGGTGDGSAAPSPAYRSFAFVTNYKDNTVTSYSVTASTGALTRLGTSPTGHAPAGVAETSPDVSKGGFLYVANQSDNTISQFRFDTSGAITPLSPPTVAAGSQPVAVVAISLGIGSPLRILAANSGDNTINDYQVNGDGTLTRINTISSGGVGPYKFTQDNNSLNTIVDVLNVTDKSLCQFTFNASTVLTPGLKLTLPSTYFPVDLAAYGDLFVVDSSQDNLVEYANFPAITANQTLKVPNSPVSVAIDHATGTSGSFDGIYVGSSAGLIYQYQCNYIPISSPITLQTAAPITLPAQQVVLRMGKYPFNPIAHRLYALLAQSNTVNVYATDSLAINTTAVSESTTGNSPSDIAFGTVSVASSTVQTTVKSVRNAR